MNEGDKHKSLCTLIDEYGLQSYEMGRQEILAQTPYRQLKIDAVAAYKEARCLAAKAIKEVHSIITDDVMRQVVQAEEQSRLVLKAAIAGAFDPGNPGSSISTAFDPVQPKKEA